MKLWLLRHGQAESLRHADAARQLTAQGREEVCLAAGHLRDQSLSGVLSSPYVRARQTAELVCEIIGFRGGLQIADWLTPEYAAKDVLRYLGQMENVEGLLLVSHQPLIGALGGLLIHGHQQNPLPMQTASLAALEGNLPMAGLMTLVALNHPGH